LDMALYDSHALGIRILHISSGSVFGSSASFNLRTITLTDKRQSPFCALSYSQGTEDTTKNITVDGCKVAVTPNLFDALEEIRRCGVESVWVDCICINQGHQHEKEQQVMIMETIYNQATTVYAWLGRKSRDSSIAMKLLGYRKPYRRMEEPAQASELSSEQGY
jgi:hypothetical protein